MADYYTQFSSMIPCDTLEQMEWLVAELGEDDEDYGQAVEFETNNSTKERPFDIWIYSDESADLEQLASIICEYQKHFDLKEPWYLEWANTCSKSRLDGFSGGAFVCYQGKEHWMNTADFVGTKIKELTQTPPKLFCPSCGGEHLDKSWFRDYLEDIECEDCGWKQSWDDDHGIPRAELTQDKLTTAPDRGE